MNMKTKNEKHGKVSSKRLFEEVKVKMVMRIHGVSKIAAMKLIKEKSAMIEAKAAEKAPDEAFKPTGESLMTVEEFLKI